MEPRTPEEQARIDERGDATDLVGAVTCFDKDGNPVSMLSSSGNELLGIATGELYEEG